MSAVSQELRFALGMIDVCPSGKEKNHLVRDSGVREQKASHFALDG